MKTRPVTVFPGWTRCLLSLGFIYLGLSPTGGQSSLDSSLFMEKESPDKIPIIYDSSGIDGVLQNELAKAAFLALGIVDSKGIQPLLIDFSSFKVKAEQKCAKILITNKFNLVVSLLDGDALINFVHAYEKSERVKHEEKLFVYTPRSLPSYWKHPSSVVIKSLQMSEEAKALALLNRVRNVGVQTLIPVLDGDSASQAELLKSYVRLGKESKWTVKLSSPIFLNEQSHSESLKRILREYTGFYTSHLKTHNLGIAERNHTGSMQRPGILLLAKRTSQLALKIASEKNHLLLSWFSPHILDFEEWANNVNSREVNWMSDTAAQEPNHFEKGTTANNSFFGLYTVNFVGSKGWDNPLRRRLLRELTTFTDASPRILSAVLTYDAAWLARDHLRNEVHLPKSGLSGIIEFDRHGFRKNGTYLGTSSVPKSTSAQATLLQPSTWILEDITSIDDTGKGQSPQISDYDVATSSILTKYELLNLANNTKNESGCNEQLMNVMTYDPFNQMPYYYFFNKANLPDTIVVPNHQGYGITFMCTHDIPQNYPGHTDTTKGQGDSVVSSLQLVCAPGDRMRHPVSCFRSHVNRRQKRSTPSGRTDQPHPVPNVQYQYSLSGKDPWNSDTQQYYYQPIGHRDFHADYNGYQTTRLDVPISEEPSTPPPPPAPATKLPELRQILKAAKPFVGSCIGSSTGCAICVLVLGRLPLGTAPTACTGPCFVGTFGSCGSLLGRVFSETTVICTELFRQGLLDAETFIADSEFGRYMSNASPYTMEVKKSLLNADFLVANNNQNIFPL